MMYGVITDAERAFAELLLALFIAVLDAEEGEDPAFHAAVMAQEIAEELVGSCMYLEDTDFFVHCTQLAPEDQVDALASSVLRREEA